MRLRSDGILDVRHHDLPDAGDEEAHGNDHPNNDQYHEVPVTSRQVNIHVQTWTDNERVTIASVEVKSPGDVRSYAGAKVWSPNDVRKYAGSAVCHPEDTFVPEIGENIAVTRAMGKYVSEVEAHTQLRINETGAWK